MHNAFSKKLLAPLPCREPWRRTPWRNILLHEPPWCAPDLQARCRWLHCSGVRSLEADICKHEPASTAKPSRGPYSLCSRKAQGSQVPGHCSACTLPTHCTCQQQGQSRHPRCTSRLTCTCRWSRVQGSVNASFHVLVRAWSRDQIPRTSINLLSTSIYLIWTYFAPLVNLNLTSASSGISNHDLEPRSTEPWRILSEPHARKSDIVQQLGSVSVNPSCFELFFYTCQSFHVCIALRTMHGTTWRWDNLRMNLSDMSVDILSGSGQCVSGGIPTPRFGPRAYCSIWRGYAWGCPGV